MSVLYSIFISSIIQVYFAISAAKKITDSEIIGPTIVKIKILEDSLADLKNAYTQLEDLYNERDN